MLPQIERARYKTIAVGIGKDRRGVLRLVIGTNNPSGALPRSIAAEVGRAICGPCADRIARAGATAASKLKP